MENTILTEDSKYMEKQMSIHLLMAAIVSIISVLLIGITAVMSWELWVIPLIAIGIIVMWSIHIGRLSTGNTYEYLCTGLLMVEFFYYGTHEGCLNDVPVIVCVLLFLLAMLDKKRLLYIVVSMYIMVLLYNFFFLDTISAGMGMQDFVQVVLGIMGTICAMAISGAMISMRKEESKGTREMIRQLEAVRQRNADFLSNVSHELRTPINMVMGISEVALGGKISPELRESVQSIQMAGKRLAGQINDILDYTEIVGDTLVVSKEKYVPASVVNDVVTEAFVRSGDKNLEIVFDLDVGIPAVLIGDAEKISRILGLLLQNAIKFTKEGGIYVYVGCRRESYGVNLDITICDTGIGMTPGQLSQIYDDIYQADTGRNRYAGGLGLGVPIVQGLLYAMEGFIRYESEEGKGTQVHISIPQGVADDTPGMMVTSPKQLCVACYFKQEKYSRSEVREYYDNMIRHMAEGLGIEAYRTYHFEDLEKLIQIHKFTHLFLAREEYEENAAYYEELAEEIRVVLIAEKKFELPGNSRLILLRKPFFALPIVNLFNGVTHGNGMGERMIEDRLSSYRGVRTLVVDDEEMNLVVARGILSGYGMEVETCHSGAEALELCMGKIYDLVVLDHMMPGMDGVETLKHIRGLEGGAYQKLPIVALTANAMSGAREMFKGEGFTEFIPKPIERSVLERVLRKVLPEHYTKAGSGEEGQEPGMDDRAAQESSSAADNSAAPVPSDSPMERLRQSGINVELGLGYCGGIEPFYLEMLQMYCSQKEEKQTEMKALYESGDWEGYAIKAHALKSTSLTIGAEELSEQAKALELAGKGGIAEYIRENHESVLRLHETVCESILHSISAAGDEKGGNAL